MINLEYRKSITEVLEILEHTNKSDVDKISPSFMKFLKDNALKEYKPNLDHNKRIREMQLSENTIGLLSIINSKYWCTSQEKEEFEEILKLNEKIYQNRLREKYSSDNLFKERQQSNKVASENMQIIEYKKPSWYTRIFEKVLRFFRR